MCSIAVCSQRVFFAAISRRLPVTQELAVRLLADSPYIESRLCAVFLSTRDELQQCTFLVENALREQTKNR